MEAISADGDPLEAIKNRAMGEIPLIGDDAFRGG
jgi:hypothetical protein